MSHPLMFKCIRHGNITTQKGLVNFKTQMSFQCLSHCSRGPDLGLKHDCMTTICSGSRIFRIPISRCDACIRNDDVNIMRKNFHLSVLQSAENKTLSLEEQAKQTKHLHKKQQEQREKRWFWKKITAFVVVFIAFYNLKWCQYDLKRREMLSAKSPILKKVLDAILGPADNYSKKDKLDRNVNSAIKN